MANKRYKEIVRSVLDSMRGFVSGMHPNAWQVSESRYGVRMVNGYPTYKGTATFYLFFRWDEALDAYKLHFMGTNSAYLNKLHDLRPMLEIQIRDALLLACIAKQALALFTDDPAA